MIIIPEAIFQEKFIDNDLHPDVLTVIVGTLMSIWECSELDIFSSRQRILLKGYGD